MQHTIALLTTHAQACETNAPIREALGHLNQARLDREVAADCRQAIEVLETFMDTAAAFDLEGTLQIAEGEAAS